MQVSRWLGHSTFTLTLDTYGDWIPEEGGCAGNNLAELEGGLSSDDRPRTRAVQRHPAVRSIDTGNYAPSDFRYISRHSSTDGCSRSG